MKKTEIFKIRVTEEERAYIDKAAKELKMTPSAWARMILSGVATNCVPKVANDKTVATKLVIKTKVVATSDEKPYKPLPKVTNAIMNGKKPFVCRLKGY